jgi:uncharacterized protein YjbJ (UPF0337 family)
MSRIQPDEGETTMGDRIDEAKGNIKKGVGDLTGDDEMKREGEAEATTAKAKREAEGAVDQGVGKAQEAWGNATDDPETEAEGKARQAEGAAKRAG